MQDVPNVVIFIIFYKYVYKFGRGKEECRIPKEESKDRSPMLTRKGFFYQHHPKDIKSSICNPLSPVLFANITSLTVAIDDTGPFERNSRAAMFGKLLRQLNLWPGGRSAVKGNCPVSESPSGVNPRLELKRTGSDSYSFPKEDKDPSRVKILR